ncbi:MAG: cupin domain-containing protein [Caldimonas sp.]
MKRAVGLIGLALTSIVASAAAWVVADAPTTAAEATTVLQHQMIPDAPGKTVVLAVVRYAPGQASSAHRHPGSVFAYVLAGEVVSQLEGQTAVTYKAGESWYEPPMAAHLVSRNASAIKPASLIAWILVDDGKPVKQPLTAR